jgi:hypothetical protein
MEENMVSSLLVEMRSASTATKSMNGDREKKIESIRIMSSYSLFFRHVVDNGTVLSIMRKATLWKAQISQTMI